MAFQSKDGKSYGSSYVAKRKDKEHGDTPSDGPKNFEGYSGGKQPGEENENSKSTPKEHGEDSVNSFSGDEAVKGEHSDAVSAEEPHATVASHGPANKVEYTHNHENGEHSVRSTHDDMHTTDSKHTSASEAYGHGEALAFEAGGEEQATSPKKREHYSQQLAEGENRNYETPDLI